MKKVATLIAVLQVLVLSAFAADTPKECALCVGAVSTLQSAPSATIPVLVQISENDLAAASPALDALTPAQRAKTTVVVSYAVVTDKDPLLDVESHTKSIVEWARLHGPFEALGVDPTAPSSEVSAYAIKRLAVTAQGQNVATRIALPARSAGDLTALLDAGAMSYADVLLVEAASVKQIADWTAEKDPAKKIYAIVTPAGANSLYDLAETFTRGATRAYATGATADDQIAFANFNTAFTGDYAFDSTAQTAVLDAKGEKTQIPVLTFIRGEDLRTIIIPRGDPAASTITSLPSDRFVRPRRVDAAGDRELTDVGRKGGRFLLGVQPVKRPFLLTAEYSEKPEVTKEAISVQTARGITVEEIIRNHQAYKSYEESIQPKYIARNATKLRFTMEGGEAIEATIAGDYFAEPGGRADWIWQDFFLNGVRWKYGRIPELPLIQPEKVTQLPLDIHLTNEYRYELIRETDMNGYRTYEVRFEPPRTLPEGSPRYRGTVWIDSRTWARIRISMIQLNLTGEVLSNEERVDFQPFARGTNRTMTPAEVAKSDPREILWLPIEVGAQQVVSAAGRANTILRSTTFTEFRLDPDDFQARLQTASASDARMVRETEAGLRYLEKAAGGERVVKEGFDTARTFMLGGIHHDSGLEFPVVPLGGIDYFNFNFRNLGIQTNVFFAGLVVAANATHPNVGNTRTNVGADLFAIAVPTTNSMYRNGVEQLGEAVKALPTNLTVRAGHPIFGFGKVDVSLGVGHVTYQRAEDTVSGFEVPSDTFLIHPSIDAQYSRYGYTVSGFYDFTRRTQWKPWGILSEYNDDQKSFSTFGAEVAKSFFLPKFQRIGVQVNYLDGQRLDRFSKYELGFFGARRIHGVPSGTVRAERAIIGHLTYGFVFSEQFRLEAFYDHGLLDDKLAGYRGEPFQGVGIAGQTIGPRGTLLRLDIGKTIGRNAQDGFVANIVVLKLF